MLRSKKKERVTELQKFRAATANLDWTSGAVEQSLKALFQAVDDLAQSEITYYSKRRRWSRAISTLTSVHPETQKRGRDKEMTAHPDVLDLARKA